MKKKSLIFLFSLFAFTMSAQLTMDSLTKIVQPLHLGYSTYFEPFKGKIGYAGPWVLTRDGGGAAFGDNVVYKFTGEGKEEWKKTVKPMFKEMETQVVAEDTKGNLFAMMLVYNSAVYRGGVERIVCYDKKGKLLWDKVIGKYASLNNPTISYAKPLDDGRIYMRGHIAKEKKANGDPKYLFWEGWIDVLGKLTQAEGEEIDWAKGEWQKKFKPE
jgi:hypothetical protein